MQAPILETERLRLRGHTLGDFEASAAMWADPAVVRFISAKPSTREEAWARLLRYGGMWPLLGYGFWLVEEKASGAYVGEVGFADFHRDITPAFDDGPEQGWALAASAHGKGYASEAVAASLAWAERTLKSPRYYCMISPENAASIRVAEKARYREFARADYKGSPSVLFRRDGA